MKFFPWPAAWKCYFSPDHCKFLDFPWPKWKRIFFPWLSLIVQTLLRLLAVNYFRKDLYLIWVQVFKNETSKICGRQPLKNFTWSILEYFVPCLTEFWMRFCRFSILIQILNESLRMTLSAHEPICFQSTLSLPSENIRLSVFMGVEKGWIGNEWVKDKCSHYIATSQFIWNVNHWTSFYIMENIGLEWVQAWQYLHTWYVSYIILISNKNLFQQQLISSHHQEQQQHIWLRACNYCSFYTMGIVLDGLA